MCTPQSLGIPLKLGGAHWSTSVVAFNCLSRGRHLGLNNLSTPQRTSAGQKVSRNFLAEKGGTPPPLTRRQLAKISLKTAFLAQKALFFLANFNRFFLSGKGGTPLPPQRTTAGQKVSGKKLTERGVPLPPLSGIFPFLGFLNTSPSASLDRFWCCFLLFEDKHFYAGPTKPIQAALSSMSMALSTCGQTLLQLPTPIGNMWNQLSRNVSHAYLNPGQAHFTMSTRVCFSSPSAFSSMYSQRSHRNNKSVKTLGSMHYPKQLNFWKLFFGVCVCLPEFIKPYLGR